MNAQTTTPAELTGAQARAQIRAGAWRHTTSGVAVGRVQANLVVLPAAAAADFRRFCDLNPQPCPLLDVTEPGSPEPRKVAPGADLRFDLPRYRVYRDGRLADEVDTLDGVWRDDLVAFLLGCSFTCERALLGAGVPIRHLELGRVVSMFRTRRQTEAAGPFRGPLVVTMRPIPQSLVEQATAITGRYPLAHGAPVHVGDPAELGIADLARPDYGDPVPIYPGEVPVYWACGVTSQAAVELARLPLVITHAPGYMFITDLPDALAQGA